MSIRFPRRAVFSFPAQRLRPRGSRAHPRAYFKALEALESRTLLSVAVGATGKTATYTDTDGDLVTIKISEGTLTSANFTTVASGMGDQLEIIDLSAGGFDGANLTVTVKKVSTGDGLADIGYINSTDHDLGTVTIPGDLGRIDAGDADTKTPAVKSLSVQSMGAFALATQGSTGTLSSNLVGALGALTIKTDFSMTTISVTGTGNASIGAITIGGTLIGGAADHSGEIIAAGNIGNIKVGALQGDTGTASGAIISTGGTMGSVTIGHMDQGSTGNQSAEIFSFGNMGAVKIGQSVQGGAGTQSAAIVSSNGKIASVTIGGDLTGSTGDQSASISAQGNLGPVKIGVILRADSGAGSASITSLGGSIAGVSVGGQMQGGDGDDSARIFAQINLGAVKIGSSASSASIFGGIGNQSALITAQTGKITSVTIAGSLSGGAGGESGAIIAGSSIGSVKITGSMGGQTGTESGFIGAGATLASVSIGGALHGGDGASSGAIMAQNISKLVTTDDVAGGDGAQSGTVISQTAITSATINGSITAGEGDSSGIVNAAGGALKTIHVVGEVIGAATGGGIMGESIGSVLIGGDINGGFIRSQGAISSVTINGSMLASTSQTTSAFVSAGTVLGSILVKQNITGFLAGTASTPAIISAGGLDGSGKSDQAIKSLTVDGNVSFTNILAGYQPNLTPMDRHAQIGSVKATGNWTASNIVAGAENSASSNTNFGDANDARIAASSTTDTLTPICSITTIKIGGTLTGTDAGTDSIDHFGFVAESFGSVSIHGAKVPLGPLTDFVPLGASGDFDLHEIA